MALLLIHSTLRLTEEVIVADLTLLILLEDITLVLLLILQITQAEEAEEEDSVESLLLAHLHYNLRPIQLKCKNQSNPHLLQPRLIHPDIKTRLMYNQHKHHKSLK